MTRGRRKSILFLAVLILLAGAACYGAIRTSIDIRSRLETGNVNIRVETLDSVEKQAYRLPEQVIVDREKTVAYTPRIINDGADCYFRVRLLAKAGAYEQELTASDLEGLQDGWEQKGRYLYYKEPVLCGESVALCQAFRIPEGWDYKKDRKLEVRVEADGLQAKHFEPDFTAEEPWGDLVVTASDVDGGNRIERLEPAGESLEEKMGNGCRVIVNRDGGLELEESGFFTHVSFLPGDSCRETLQLSNREIRRVQILLKAEWEKSPFLDQMQIRMDRGTDLYEGPLKGADLKEYRPLVTLEPGETRNVDVTLSFPETADNPYQQSSDEIRWCFAIKQDRFGGIPVTGENCLWLLAAASLCIAAGSAAWILKRRNDHETAE